MSWVAVGVGVVAAAGSVAQGVTSRNAARDAAGAQDDLANQLRALNVDIDFEDTFAFNNPNLGNAGLSGITASGLMQLGMPIGNALQQGSPFAGLQNALGASGLSEDDFKQVSNLVRKQGAVYNRFREQGLSHEEASRLTNKRGRKNGGTSKTRRAAALAGYTNLNDLYRDQFQFELQAEEFERRAAEIAPEVQAGRISAIQAISNIQQNFTGIEELEQRFIQQGDADLDEQQREADERTLQAANTYGLNPARGLSDTAEQTAEAKQDLRYSDALIKAVQLGIGQFGVASQLQATLNAPSQSLLGAADLTSQGNQFSGSIAANQANVLNELRAKLALEEANLNLGLNSQAAQLNTASEIGRSNSDAQFTNSLIGAGTSLVTSLAGGAGGAGGGGGSTAGLSSGVQQLMGGGGFQSNYFNQTSGPAQPTGGLGSR